MSNFKHTLPETNDDGYYTILQQLDISLDKWICLMHMLESGDPLNYLHYIHSGYYTGLTGELNNIQKTSIKLGGIPYLDNYYANIIKRQEKENRKINETPGVPEDDKNGLYQWSATVQNPTGPTLANFIFDHKANDGWTLSCVRNQIHYYYRNWPDAHPDAHSTAHPDAHSTAHSDAHPDAHSDAESDAHSDASYNSEEDY